MALPGARETIDNWDLFSDDTVVKDSDEVLTLKIKVGGSAARIIKNEAHRRGLSYSEMAQVFIEQGVYFWNPKQ
jgi:hypothetical protein